MVAKGRDSSRNGGNCALTVVNNWGWWVEKGRCSILEQVFPFFYVAYCIILVDVLSTSRYRHRGSLSGPNIFIFSGVARDESVVLRLFAISISQVRPATAFA